jgi:hypothetical protein
MRVIARRCMVQSAQLLLAASELRRANGASLAGLRSSNRPGGRVDPGGLVRSDPVTAMKLPYSCSERVAYSPADTERGSTLRITREWMTEDGWPNGV